MRKSTFGVAVLVIFLSISTGEVAQGATKATYLDDFRALSSKLVDRLICTGCGKSLESIGEKIGRDVADWWYK